jgi:hypothetical protein
MTALRRRAFGIGLAGFVASPLRALASAEPLQPVGALRADADALYQGLQLAHFRLDERMPRPAMDRAFAALRGALNRPLSAFEAAVHFQRFVALGRVAHARIDALAPAFEAFRASSGLAFPLRLRLRERRLYVLQNLSENEDIQPGDEVLSIEGLAAGDVLSACARHVSADTWPLAEALMEPRMAALLWLEHGPRRGFRITLRKANGATRKLRLEASTRLAMRQRAAQRPATLELDPTERVARQLPSGVAYLRPGVFLDLQGPNPFDSRSFQVWLDTTMDGFIQSGARRLLLDLRDNPGGDNAFSDALVAWFAQRPFRFYSRFVIKASAAAVAANAARLAAEPEDGSSHRLARLYDGVAPGGLVELSEPPVPPRAGARFTGAVDVLVNRRSFSNSVALAALVQDHNFGRIIGEATSDLASTLGAMEQFHLPHSGLAVGFPKARIVRASGDARPLGVHPDRVLAVPLIEGDDDPVLQAALALD